MPKWIHDRAMSMKKDMEKTYGPEKAEQVAFAVATQQAHRLGKSPKTFKSKVTGKKERFGTPEGRREAKSKFDKPKKEYQKTAEAAMDTILENNEDQSTGGEMPHLNPQSDPDPSETNDVAAFAAEASGKGAQHWKDADKLLDNLGEKPTFQREEVVKNPTADKPDTPNIKVSSDVMWGSFFEELQKIAVLSPQKRYGKKVVQELGASLEGGRREAAELVAKARKKLPWHTRAVQAVKREEHPSVVRKVREAAGESLYE